MTKLITRFFILWLILVACNTTSNINDGGYQKLKKIFIEDYKLDATINKVIVINHRGCFACNKEYSTFWENTDSLDFSSVAFIFTKKDFLDTEALLKNIKPAQVVYDYRELLFQHDFIKENSAYIQLNENGIDTILDVSLHSIKNDLEYISKQIKKPQ